MKFLIFFLFTFLLFVLPSYCDSEGVELLGQADVHIQPSPWPYGISQGGLITEDSNSTEEADQCESDIFPCSNKIVGNLVLIVFYGLTLGCAAKLISDGAEMLLDLNFPPSIVGGVVLPVMGAVPDSVMILVSGLGDPATAQDQISVGMGTLAGSTILLLTIAWGVSLIVGRTDVERDFLSGKETCKDKECGEGYKWFGHGVSVSREVMFVAIGMMGTCIPYLIVQASDWAFGARKIKETQPEYVRIAALITMIIAFVGFIGYLASQVLLSLRGENPRIEIHEKIKRERMAATAAHSFMIAGLAKQNREAEKEEEAEPLSKPQRSAVNVGRLWKMRARASAQSRVEERGEEEAMTSSNPRTNDNEPLVERTNEEEEEPKWKIALNSFSRLIGGVAIVTIFSDPMCDALTALTDSNNPQYIPIGAFYVSFVVTPLCSNASELVSSILLAMQKEKDKINMTYSQIYGACIMNNTLCLGVFCALIYFKDLEWYFSAEVTVILLFEVILGVAAVCFRNVYYLLLSVIVISFYPISLGMVAFMEEVIGWG